MAGGGKEQCPFIDKESAQGKQSICFGITGDCLANVQTVEMGTAYSTLDNKVEKEKEVRLRLVVNDTT